MSQRSWNLLAKSFEDSVCDITSTSGDVLGEMVEQLAPSRRQTLVDAGCGIGTFTLRFGERFGRIVAFDFANQMVSRARRRCRTLDHATWQTLPLEEAGQCLGAIAHLAVCLNVITSSDADLRRRQWSSLWQLIRPGGRLLVVVPARESAEFVAEVEGSTNEGPRDLIRRTDTLQKHYSRSQLRSQLVRLGAREIRTQKIHYSWSEEGLSRSAQKTPWDWLCLAKKPR